MPVLSALEPLEPQDPRSVGVFRLRARLGSGGMGRVYLGFSPAGRAVAVKVVHPELARDEQFRKRFRREVTAARRVNGAYTAPVIAAGPDDEIPWLATVYVAGPSVADIVATAGPLSPESVLRLGGGLGEALADIHATDVVHRDLKPSNVLLAADGPRVIDFGISRVVETSALTTTSVVIGTPGFMAPEQATGDEAERASDVFSLGAVLAFASTGRTPFGTGSPVSVLFRLMHAEPDLDGIDGPLRALISSCMAKDPAARPTADEIAALIPVPDLDQASAGANAGTFWPSALDALVRRYAEPADELPLSGAALAADAVLAADEEPAAANAGPQPPETVTVQPLTGTDRPTDPTSEGTSGGQGSTPDRPLSGAASPSGWPGRARRPLPLRGVLAAFLAVLVAAGVVAGVELLGGSKTGTSASRAPTATVTSPPVPSVPRGTATGSSGGTATPGTPLPTSEPAVSASPAPTPTSASPSSAPPHRTYPVPLLLGVPDWNGYCKSIGQGAATLTAAQDAYGWHCANAPSAGIDPNAVCSWAFGRPANQTTNAITDFYDANSWQCWSASTQLNAPDWNGYCKSIGQGTATLVAAQHAYGWHCTNAPSAGIDIGAVCAWSNGASTPVLARFQDFYDPSSWQCWV